MIRKKQMQVGGHRGNGETDRDSLTANEANFSFPENTLLSIEKAIDSGATFIEIDAVLSKDGVPMVIHSNDLRQHVFKGEVVSALNDKPYVSQYEAAELNKMVVGPRDNYTTKRDDVTGLTIPTLEQVFTLLQKYPEVTLNIELKDTQATADVSRNTRPHSLVQQVTKAVKESGMDGERLLFSSFAVSALEEAKQELPHIKRGLLFLDDTNEAIGKPLFADEDGSCYLKFTAETVVKYADSLELSALHPEISSLPAADNKQAVKNFLTAIGVDEKKHLRAHPLSLNIWCNREAIPSGQWREQMNNTYDFVETFRIEAAMITNHPTELAESIEAWLGAGTEQKRYIA